MDCQLFQALQERERDIIRRIGRDAYPNKVYNLILNENLEIINHVKNTWSHVEDKEQKLAYLYGAMSAYELLRRQNESNKLEENF